MNEDFQDRLGRQLRDWLEAAGQKTGEVARVSRRQVELLQIEWDLTRRRADLGERFLRLLEQGEFPSWARDSSLVEMVETVRGLERRQRQKRLEIEEIRKQGGRGSDEDIHE